MDRYVMLKADKFNNLVAADRYSEKYIEALKVGDLVRAKIVKSERTYWRHKRFFEMIGFAYKHLDERFDFSIDSFVKQVTLEAGYYTATEWDFEGVSVIVKVPDTINFKSMKEEEFKKYVSDCMDVICQKYLDRWEGKYRKGEESIVDLFVKKFA